MEQKFPIEYAAFKHARWRCRVGFRGERGWLGVRFRFKSFEQFMKVLGPKPEGTLLDRRDNNGDYEPGNVRWATPSESQFNRRKWGENHRVYKYKDGRNSRTGYRSNGTK